MAQLADRHSDSQISIGKGLISVDRLVFVLDVLAKGELRPLRNSEDANS